MQKAISKKKIARTRKARETNPPTNKKNLRLRSSNAKIAQGNKEVTTTARTSLKRAKSPFPKRIQPMLATLVDKPFDEPDWSYEIKWDGYRAIAYLRSHLVDLISRNNKSFNDKFYPILEELKKWKKQAVIDGEIIVVNNEGISDFEALQNWRSEADGHLIFYVFDLLWYDGYSLMERPLQERRSRLQTLFTGNEEMIRMSAEVESDGVELFDVAARMGLEGIIAKKKNSIYLPGIRTKEWLKIKTEKRQEAIIAGYTKNENSSKKFSALLMGAYNNSELEFIGPVGTGFSMKVQQELLDKLAPLKTSRCPFKEVPEYNKPSRFRPDPPKAEVTWVKPMLVAEISSRASSGTGGMRQASFKGLREDKKPNEVTLEKAAHTKDIIKKEEKVSKPRVLSGAKDATRKTLLNPVDETQVREIDGHQLKFTNLSKIYWPKEKISKRDMLNYYYQITQWILPYMKDRPQTLNRFPHGINGESFYQKDITGKAPEWIKGFPYYSEADNRQKNFLVCADESSLMYIASLGCIEMNPWSSRVQTPDHPDWCIIDLDPDKNPFNDVIKTARVTKEILDQVNVPSYCKTSGSTGLHIYVPLGAKYTYEESKEFGRRIVKLVHAEIPSFTSIERLTEKRKGKIYLDFLQNRPQATVATAYSLRPKPGAPISAPLHWEEVKPGLRITDFNIFNMVNRVKEVGDLFKPVLGKGIDLNKAVRKLDALLKS